MDPKLKRRRPAPGKTGLRETGKAGKAISGSESIPDLAGLQAFHIHRRFSVSWPVARAIAALAFAGGAQ